MRGLELQDVFAVARIIAKLDVANEIKALTDKIQKGEVISTAAGVEFVMTLLGKASAREVEKEMYSFIADVFELKIEDIRHMKPQALIDKFKEGDAAEWRDFFTSVVRLITKNY